jgi:predicted HicB family RNase H-like nuclease
MPAPLNGLKVEGSGVSDAGFAGVGALDAADAEEFLAAALEVGFHGLYVGRRHDEDHADAHVEGLQQLVGLDFSECGEKFEDAGDRPRSEIDLRFNPRRKDARQIAGNAAAGDVRKSGNPAARNDILQRRSVTQMGL